MPIVLLSAIACPAPVAQAQDWQVKRDPFDARLVARYKKRLENRPFDTSALRRLVGIYRKHRTLKKLISEYERKTKTSNGSVKAPARSMANAWTILAKLYIENREKEKAKLAFEKSIAANPEDVRVHMAAADLASQLNDADGAAALYRSAASLATNKKDASIKRAALTRLFNLALDKGSIDRANEVADELLKVDPKNVSVQLSLAEALQAHRKHEQALTLYRRILPLLKSDKDMQIEVSAKIAEAYTQSGKRKKALSAYWKVLERMRSDFHLRGEVTDRIIEIYRDDQKLPELIGIFEKRWPAKSRGHFEWRTFGELFEETGSQSKAISAYEKATSKAPYELDTHKKLIELLEEAGQDERSLKRYQKLVALAPGESRFHLDLADKYWGSGNETKALALLKRLDKRMARDAGAQSAIADLYVRWGRTDLAVAVYKKLTRLEPKDPSHRVRLGELFYQRGDKKAALKTWKPIARSKSARDLSLLAQVYLDHDMVPEALAGFSSAIKADPKRSKTYKGRATVFERSKRYLDAVTDWETILALAKSDNQARVLRAEARRRIVQLLGRAGGQHLQINAKNWERAYQRIPPDIDAGYLLVEHYSRGDAFTKNSSKAKQILEQMLQKDPANLDAKHQLVSVYRENSEYKKAIDLLNVLAKSNPGRQQDYFSQIAEIQTILHRDSDAIAFSKKALEKNPNDPAGHARLAERLEQMQKYDEAIASYEKSIELGGRDYASYFAVSRLYRNQGKILQAARVYRELFRRATNDEAIEKAGREAIDLEELTENANGSSGLGDLEKAIASLAFTMKHKTVYRRILVELYGRYIPMLADDLESESESRRAQATTELDRIRRHGVSPLLQALSGKSDPAQRDIAISVLGYIGNSSAVAPLLRVARQKQPTNLGTSMKRRDIRVDAILSAGRLRVPSALKDLKRLASHSEVNIREAAIYALGLLNDPKSLTVFEKALATGSIKAQSLSCLGLSGLKANRVQQTLRRIVSDKKRDNAVRAFCAYGMGAQMRKDSVPQLSEILENSEGPLLKAAAWSLGAIATDSADAKRALIKSYFSKPEIIRNIITTGLLASRRGKLSTSNQRLFPYPLRSGRFDEKEALRQIVSSVTPTSFPEINIKKFKNELIQGIRRALALHRDIQLRTLRDLDRFPDRLSFGFLTDRAENVDKEAALSVASSIAADLQTLAGHQDPTVRKTVASVLSKTEGKRTIETVESMMQDSVRSVRNEAMYSAAKLSTSDVGKKYTSRINAALVKFLRSKDWRSRTSAAKAIGRTAQGSSIGDHLIPILTNDQNGFVREAAANSLGTLRKGKRALVQAASYKKERTVEVRLAALRSLDKIDPGAARAVAQQALEEDPNQRMRRLATMLLARK